MADGIKINIVAPDVAKMVDPYDRLIKKLEEVQARMDDVTDSAAKMRAGVSGAGRSSPGGGAGSPNSGGGSARKARMAGAAAAPGGARANAAGRPLSPSQQARVALAAGAPGSMIKGQAQRNLAWASAAYQANPTAANGQAVLQHQSALKAANAAIRANQPPPTMAQKFQKAAYSSRFGAGGAMPLVGQSLDILGLGKFAGPVAAAAIAIKGLSFAASSAADKLGEIRNSKIISGGSDAAAERLRMRDKQAGLDDGTTARAGREIQNAAMPGSDPTVRNQLRKLGYSDMPGPQRKLDTSGYFDDFQKRTKAAGMKSDEIRKLADSIGGDTAQAYEANNPQSAEAKGLKKLHGTFPEPIFDLNPGLKAIRALGEAGLRVFGGGKFFGDDESKKKNDSALEKNTKATNDLALALRNQRSTFGGGARLGQEIPHAATTLDPKQFKAYIQAGF